MNDGLTLPLEVRDHDGDLIGLLLMNAKSHNKSLERNELWTVVPPGDRVLPLEGTKFRTLEVVGGHHYRVVLEPGPSAKMVREALKGVFSRLTSTDLPAAAIVNGSQPTLQRLRQVIAQRRRDMPAGSYTTLLFQKGEDKIRKKTGEEAIELLLATTPAEIVSESADLLYHLMVLLEVKGIAVDDVLSELETRMK